MRHKDTGLTIFVNFMIGAFFFFLLPISFAYGSFSVLRWVYYKDFIWFVIIASFLVLMIVGIIYSVILTRKRKRKQREQRKKREQSTK